MSLPRIPPSWATGWSADKAFFDDSERGEQAPPTPTGSAQSSNPADADTALEDDFEDVRHLWPYPVPCRAFSGEMILRLPLFARPSFAASANGRKVFFPARPPADVCRDTHVWIEFVKTLHPRKFFAGDRILEGRRLAFS